MSFLAIRKFLNGEMRVSDVNYLVTQFKSFFLLKLSFTLNYTI